MNCRVKALVCGWTGALTILISDEEMTRAKSQQSVHGISKSEDSSSLTHEGI